MPPESLITMIGAVGIIWGGFFFVLITALRKERMKSHASDDQ